jgi:hypothetical protein
MLSISWKTTQESLNGIILIATSNYDKFAIKIRYVRYKETEQDFAQKYTRVCSFKPKSMNFGKATFMELHTSKVRQKMIFYEL